MVTGDQVHGLDLLLMEAYPGEWPTTEGKIGELEFDSLVPRHGAVQHGRAMLTLFKDYLTEMNQLVKDAVAEGKNLVTLQSEVTPERLHSLSHQDFGRTMQRNREECWDSRQGDPCLLSPVLKLNRFTTTMSGSNFTQACRRRAPFLSPQKDLYR